MILTAFLLLSSLPEFNCEPPKEIAAEILKKAEAEVLPQPGSKLSMTDLHFPVEALIQFAQMTDDEKRKHLESEKITVVISPDALSEELKIWNENLDPTLRKFYEDYLQTLDIGGRFLPPYTTAGGFEAGTKRPAEDKLVMLLDQGTAQHSLVHEYAHYLIYKSNADRRKLDPKKPIYFMDEVSLRIDSSKKKIDELYESKMKQEERSAEWRRLEEELDKVFFDLWFDRINPSASYVFEELDLYKLLIDQSQQIGLTRVQIRLDENHAFRKLQGFEKMMKNANLWNLLKAKRENPRSMSPDLKAKYEKLVKTLKEIGPRYETYLKWLKIDLKESAFLERLKELDS